jgi:alpha-L-fucosidase
MMRASLVAACLLAGAARAAAQPAPAPAPEPASERTARLAAWEGLRYGMFIHFGISTFIGEECPSRETSAADFRPSALDPDQWIRVARDAGMKYAVLTTKHCAGHCLWPSRLTDFTVAASPGARDVVGEFVAACRKYGVRPGFYYLLGWDAHHQARLGPEAYEALCAGQLRELLTGYGPIEEVFLDIPFDTGPDMAGVLARLYALVKRLQPDCLVLPNQGFADGSRIERARPTWRGRDLGKEPVPLSPRDLVDGERTLPPPAGHEPRIELGGRRFYLPMEVCDTLCDYWFWQPGDAPRPARSLFRFYQACEAGHANLLLDVGPDRTGRIPEASAKRLLELGAAIEGRVRFPPSLAAGRPARASNVFHGDPAWGPEKAVDAALGTRWATDEGVRAAWLEVDLGGPRRLASAWVREAFDRVRAFEIQVPDGAGGWRAIARGGAIGGEGLEVKLEPATAAAVRLAITDATDGPTIWDFEVSE